MKPKVSITLLVVLVASFICACKFSRTEESSSSLNAINLKGPEGLDEAVKKKIGENETQYKDLKVVGFRVSVRGIAKGSSEDNDTKDAVCNFPSLKDSPNSDDLCSATKPDRAELPPNKPDGKSEAGQGPKPGDHPGPGNGPGGFDGVPTPPPEPGGKPGVEPVANPGYYETEAGTQELAKIKIKSGFEKYCATISYYCKSEQHKKPIACLAHPGDTKNAICGTAQDNKVKLNIKINWTKEFGGDVNPGDLKGQASGDLVDVDITTEIVE